MSDLKKIANHLKAMEAFLGEEGQGSVHFSFHCDSSFYLIWEMWGKDWAYMRCNNPKGFYWLEAPDKENEEDLIKIFNNLNTYWKANKDDFLALIEKSKNNP